MRRLIILGGLLLSLCGCIETAFVAGAASASAVVNDHRKVSTILTDENITQQCAKAFLSNDELTYSAHVTVATYNGIVLLLGQTPTAALRQTAQSLVQSVPKVKRVYNEISISAPTSALTRSSDTWLTTKVKGEMVLVKRLKSGAIKVVTENGVVYLMGIVSHSQADLAVAAARRVGGVQRVVKVFEYTTPGA